MIAGRTPGAARRLLRDTLQRAVSSVSAAVITDHVAGVEGELNVACPLALVSGAAPLTLTLWQYYAVLSDRSGTRSERWRVQTTGYSYKLDDADGREILSYHWHPTGRSPVVRPHLHLSAGTGALRSELQRTHLGTGFVTPVTLLTLLLESFAVRPRGQSGSRSWRRPTGCSRVDGCPRHHPWGTTFLSVGGQRQRGEEGPSHRQQRPRPPRPVHARTTGPCQPLRRALFRRRHGAQSFLPRSRHRSTPGCHRTLPRRSAEHHLRAAWPTRRRTGSRHGARPCRPTGGGLDRGGYEIVPYAMRAWLLELYLWSARSLLMTGSERAARGLMRSTGPARLGLIEREEGRLLRVVREAVASA